MRVSLHTFILLMLFLIPSTASGGYPEKTIKKALKYAGKSWYENKGGVEGEVGLVTLEIDQTSRNYSANDTLFRFVEASATPLGYLLISSAMGRFDPFDFMMLYDQGKNLVDIRILTYRSEYGSQIISKAWLRKFCDLSPRTNLQYGIEIDALSGATISASSLTREVNRVNQLILEIGE